MSAVEVRRALGADVPDLARLRWTWSQEGLPPHGVDLGAYTRDLEAWMRTHEDHVAYVALLGGEAVGMAWLALLPRVPDPRGFDRLGGDVQSVYVSPEHRRTGVGSALVDLVLSDATNAGCTSLTVHANPAALPLYRRFGFGGDGMLLSRPLG